MDVYHILNRGVEKRDIVLSDDDRMRFVRSLYIFNDINSAPNSVSQPKSWHHDGERNCLVHIHAWCLMNNHYHLLLTPLHNDTNNISLFIKKLNMGYAKFFNSKYERSGYLWQGRYKKILISSDAQFEYIPYYVHLNALDYTNYNWRTGHVAPSDLQQTKEQLNTYRWSSYNDYNGKKNFPSILYTELLSKVLGTSTHQDAEICQIISGNDRTHNDICERLELS